MDKPLIFPIGWLKYKSEMKIEEKAIDVWEWAFDSDGTLSIEKVITEDIDHEIVGTELDKSENVD